MAATGLRQRHGFDRNGGRCACPRGGVTPPEVHCRLALDAALHLALDPPQR